MKPHERRFSDGRRRVPRDGSDRGEQRVLGGRGSHRGQTAAETVRDLRVAEVIREDVTIENGAISSYRVRLGISFKYDSGD